MALTITITDPKIIKLIEQKAAEAGISASEAVEHALEERNPQTTLAPAADGSVSGELSTERAARVAELVARMQARFTDEDRVFDYDAWLYDENGIPH